MKIDNSRMLAFQKCPLFYFEKYVRGVEPDRAKLGWDSDSLGLGKRVHELLEEHYSPTSTSGPPAKSYPASTSARVEAEAQVILAAYRLEYPEEPFEIVDVERTFEVPINGGRHSLIGKFDGIIRENGQLKVFETKTQKRGSLRNLPEAWAMRSQVGLYLWAAAQIYSEPVNNILLNVITRPSEKGQVGPEFRRDYLERTDEQMDEALANLQWVADQIEALQVSHGSAITWPSNRNACIDGRFKCEFYDPHLLGWTPEIKARFTDAEEYLDL